MTVQNPPTWITGGTYTPELDRRLIEAVFGGKPGVLTAGALAVTQTGVASMNLDVAGGMVLVDGTEATYQGQYLCENRGTAQVTLDAADSTNPRIDLVVAKVRDSAYSGASADWQLTFKKGTAAAVPAEPTPDANSFVLAKVTVRSIASGGGTILTADIEDRRIQSGKGLATAAGGTVVTTSTQRPTAGLHEGLSILETDTNRESVYNGSAWVNRGGYHQLLPYNVAPVLANGTATGYFPFADTGIVGTAPFPLKMVVRADMQVGFASTTHESWFLITDLAGTWMTHGTGIGFLVGEIGVTVDSSWRGLSIVGSIDIATGGNLGAKIQYKNASGNLYVMGNMRLEYIPLTA